MQQCTALALHAELLLGAWVKTTPEFSACKAQLTEEIRVESIRGMEMASAA